MKIRHVSSEQIRNSAWVELRPHRYVDPTRYVDNEIVAVQKALVRAQKRLERLQVERVEILLEWGGEE